jgi:hypothetical protein
MTTIRVIGEIRADTYKAARRLVDELTDQIIPTMPEVSRIGKRRYHVRFDLMWNTESVTVNQRYWAETLPAGFFAEVIPDAIVLNSVR